jgi:hypothetical protein
MLVVYFDPEEMLCATAFFRVCKPPRRFDQGAAFAADTDPLTAHDIASEATWADKYRDSDRDTTKIRYRRHGGGTSWTSSYRSPILPQPVSAISCSRQGSRLRKVRHRPAWVDKIKQFASELGDRATNASEQLLALKFLLHLVGDLHQPRHGRPRRGREQEVRFGRRTAPEQPSSLLGCRVRGAAGDRPATSCGRLDRGDVGTATARVVERNISRLGDRSLLTCSTRRVRPATTTRRSRRISASASVHGASCAGCRTSTYSRGGLACICSEPCVGCGCELIQEPSLGRNHKRRKL